MCTMKRQTNYYLVDVIKANKTKLTAVQMQQLVILYKKTEDIRSKRKLEAKIIENCLKMILKIAENAKVRNACDKDDIIQEANIFLLKALRNYKVNKKASFITYAYACVSMQLIYTKKQLETPFKVPQYIFEKESKLNRFLLDFQKKYETEATLSDILKHTDLKIKDIEYIHRINVDSLKSIEDTTTDAEKELKIEDILSDERENLEDKIENEMLEEKLYKFVKQNFKPSYLEVYELRTGYNRDRSHTFQEIAEIKKYSKQNANLKFKQIQKCISEFLRKTEIFSY